MKKKKGGVPLTPPFFCPNINPCQGQSGRFPLSYDDVDYTLPYSLPGGAPVDHGQETDGDDLVDVGLGKAIQPFPPERGFVAAEQQRTVVGKFQGQPAAGRCFLNYEFQLTSITLLLLYQHPSGNVQYRSLPAINLNMLRLTELHQRTGTCHQAKLDSLDGPHRADNFQGTFLNVAKVQVKEVGRGEGIMKFAGDHNPLNRKYGVIVLQNLLAGD
ncbi:hypothetical protein [Geomonas sp. Red276]